MAEKSKTPSTRRTLQAAAKGLLFPSESDRPIKAFVWSAEQVKGATTAEEALIAVTGADKAKLKGLSVTDLFKPMITEQDWHGEEEKASLAKAKAFVETLMTTLTEATAFRIEGETTIPAYVIGKDAAGNWAGVHTVLVET